jgi:ABC-2 type transport system permease protein
MIDLFAADLRRIWWRPMAVVVAFVVIIFTLAVGVVVFQHTAKHPFDMRTGLPNAVATFTSPLVLVGFAFGATMLGADYTSRAFTTLLTWEPRRARLLFSRAATCAAVTFCASVAALILLILVLLPAAAAHGTGHGAAYGSLAALITRSALLAAAACAIGVSCAAIGRSTAVAVIGAVLYLGVVEQLLISQAPDVGRWLLVNASLSWIAASPNASNGPGGAGPGHTIATSGLILLVGVVALHALANFILGRRDVV